MTYRELVYMVLDEVKAISDDIPFTEEHIIFLLSKYRNYILATNYLQGIKQIPMSNYQTICLDLEIDNSDIDFCGKQNMLISKEQVPFIMSIGHKEVYPKVGFNYGKIMFVDNNRFKHIGNNRYTKNLWYATIGPNNHLYIKSDNPSFLFVKQVEMTAIFDDIELASKLSCDNNCDASCDIMDSVFPLEEAFATTLIQLVVQDISNAMYRLSDNENNAADDTDDLAQMISRYTNAAYYRATHPNSKKGSN